MLTFHAQLQEIAQVPAGRALLAALFGLAVSSMFAVALLHRQRTLLTRAETRIEVLTGIVAELDPRSPLYDPEAVRALMPEAA
jgi:hypothetical protein